MPTNAHMNNPLRPFAPNAFSRSQNPFALRPITPQVRSNVKANEEKKEDNEVKDKFNDWNTPLGEFKQ